MHNQSRKIFPGFLFCLATIFLLAAPLFAEVVSLDAFDQEERGASTSSPAKPPAASTAVPEKNCFANPGKQGKLYVIAVNGSGSKGEFSDAVKKNLNDRLTDLEKPEVFVFGDFDNNAKETGLAIRNQVDDILAKDPHAKILVAAHSFGAISAFNYKINNEAVSYKLYDPPYNALGTGMFAGMMGSWLFDIPRQIRNARNNAIDTQLDGNWTNGKAVPTEEHTAFKSNNSVLNGVSDWVRNNCQ